MSGGFARNKRRKRAARPVDDGSTIGNADALVKDVLGSLSRFIATFFCVPWVLMRRRRLGAIDDLRERRVIVDATVFFWGGAIVTAVFAAGSLDLFAMADAFKKSFTPDGDQFARALVAFAVAYVCAQALARVIAFIAAIEHRRCVDLMLYALAGVAIAQHATALLLPLLMAPFFAHGAHLGAVLFGLHRALDDVPIAYGICAGAGACGAVYHEARAKTLSRSRAAAAAALILAGGVGIALLQDAAANFPEAQLTWAVTASEDGQPMHVTARGIGCRVAERTLECAFIAKPVARLDFLIAPDGKVHFGSMEGSVFYRSAATLEATLAATDDKSVAGYVPFATSRNTTFVVRLSKQSACDAFARWKALDETGRKLWTLSIVTRAWLYQSDLATSWHSPHQSIFDADLAPSLSLEFYPLHIGPLLPDLAALATLCDSTGETAAPRD